MRLSTCAARLGSPPRGAHSAGESRAREGLASWHTADRAGVGHSAASHVPSRSFEAPVRDGVRVLAARVDGPIGKAGQVAQRSGMTGAAGMGGGGWCWVSATPLGRRARAHADLWVAVQHHHGVGRAELVQN